MTTTHITQAGENLYEIAKKYNIAIQDLEKANEGKIKGKNKIIQPNEKLVIPEKPKDVYAPSDKSNEQGKTTQDAESVIQKTSNI